MRKQIAVVLMLILCLCLAACSIGPKEKTMLLREPSAAPTETAAAGGSFEIKKQYTLPLDKLDQSGDLGASGVMVVDWLDGDNLLVLAAVSSAQGETEGELGAMSCQYGFYNPIKRTEGQIPEYVSLSPDKKVVSYQMQNEEVGKYTVLYSLSMQRQVLSCDSFRVYSAPVWSRNSESLAAASVVNGQYGLTLIDVSQGSTTKVLESLEEEIAVLDYLNDGTVLLRRGGEGGSTVELLNTKDGSTFTLPAGEVSQANGMSATGALALYGSSLRFVSAGPDESQVIDRGVQAYALTPNRLYAALAIKNMDGSVDLAIGRWSGTHIINKKIVYKNIGYNVGRMLFSPDNLRLYIEGESAADGRPHSAIVLEFS